MFSRAAALAVNADQKKELEALVRNGNSSQKVALRCRLLLLAHQGIANQSIAQQLNVSRPTVLALRAAFAKDGMTAVTGIRRRKTSGQGSDAGRGAENPRYDVADTPRRR